VREPEVLPKGSGGASSAWWDSPEPAGRPPSRERRRSPLVAALLSCLVPGAGQLYLGERRRGAAMLAITVLCLALAVGLWSEPTAVSRMLVQPRALLALLVADAGLLVFRVVAVLDAWLLGARDPRRPTAVASRWRRGAAAGLVVVVALTAAPHAAAAYYDLEAHDLLTSVFAGEDPQWQARDRPLHQSGEGLATAIPGRVTILLIGGDAGPGRRGLRTDTMIVASYELATGKVTLFGLPRNMVQVPLPPGAAADYFSACHCFPRLLNELYAFAEDERPDLFPHSRRPGIAAVAGAAEELLGLPIDHYALVDLLGFVDLVDALGGVTVNNLKPLDIEIDRLGRPGPRPAFEIQPGRRHLNGFTALAYSRSRETTSDYDRMQRQRCVIGSLARQTNPTELLAAFPRLVRVLKHTVATDIPASRLPSLIQAAGDKPVKVATVGFTPPTYNRGWSNGYPIPDVPKIRRAVQRLISPAGATTTTTQANPDGLGATPTTRAPSTNGGSSANGSRGPACSTVG
jgi:polyisoprenyl-teichoic acid--peptidoglycan teichoic acid transferase